MIYALVRGLYHKDITSQYNIHKRTKSLSDDEIHCICKDVVDNKIGVYSIAEKYGVSADYMYALMKGEYRTDITAQYGNMSTLLHKHLAKEQVYDICDDLKRGLSYTVIAKKYGVSKSCVAGIRKGRLHPEITRKYQFV